ncbi:hypothetical protein V8C26DRAFT_385412 [Trichoderma gracile]
MSLREIRQRDTALSHFIFAANPHLQDQSDLDKNDALIILALHHLHNYHESGDSPARLEPDWWDAEQHKNRYQGLF